MLIIVLSKSFQEAKKVSNQNVGNQIIQNGGKEIRENGGNQIIQNGGKEIRENGGNQIIQNDFESEDVGETLVGPPEHAFASSWEEVIS